MYRISCWASRNVMQSRIIVIVGKLACLFLSFSIGVNLYKSGILLPLYEWCFAGALLIVAGAWLYPSRARRSAFFSNFTVRKFCDFIIPIGASIVMIACANNKQVLMIYSTADAAFSTKAMTAQEIIRSGKAANELTRQEKKILRKEAGQQFKKLTTALVKGDSSDALKALYILLSVIALIAASTLLASVVCSLACSGAEALAAILAIVGGFLIIYGFIVLVKRILKGPKMHKEEHPESDTEVVQ